MHLNVLLVKLSLPGPCLNNGPCPAYAQCVDTSDNIRASYECVCQLGKIMEGGRCISMPPATPTPRPVPTLSPGAQSTVNVITRY